MRRTVTLWFLAAGLLLCAGVVAAAHPEAWFMAMIQVRRDGTFVVDLKVNRELVPEGFGRTAPPLEIADIPIDADVQNESRGVLARFSVLFDGKPVAWRAAWLKPSGEAEFLFRLTGDVPPGSTTVALGNSLKIDPWSAGVRHEGVEGESAEFVAVGAPMKPVALLDGFAPKKPPPPVAPVPAAEPAKPPPLDRVLFLIALFLVSAAPKRLVMQAAAYATAHVLALALSATDVVRLPAAVVSPLVAASLVYVAVENLVSRDVRVHRLALVFVCGLLHGLRDVGMASDGGMDVAVLGVLLIVAATVGTRLREQPWYRARVVVPASLAVAVVGLYWTATRALSG